MDARSYTSFGNDDALDFVAEVEEDGMPAAAVRRVLDYSELKDLWADSKDFDKWRADVHGLLERLT